MQHGAVQVGDVVEPVERAVVAVADLVVADDERLVGEQIEVDGGAQLREPLPALHPVVGAIGGHGGRRRTEQVRHDREPVARAQRQVVPDDRRLDLPVEGGRGDRVLDAGDDEDLVDHGIVGAAQRPQGPGEPLRRGDRGVVGEQHREELLVGGAGGELLVLQVAVGVEQGGTVSVFGEEPHVQGGLARQPRGVHRVEQPGELRQGRGAGVEPEALVGAQPLQQPAHPGAFLRVVQAAPVHRGQLLGRVVQQMPVVEPLRRRVGHRGQRRDLQSAGEVVVHLHSLVSPRCVGHRGGQYFDRVDAAATR